MLSIEQISAAPAPDGWHIRWRIGNPDPEPVTIFGAWLPHSRFRSAELALSLCHWGLGSVELNSVVAWNEPAGTAVANAFLILRLASSRAFARLTVTAGADGEPHAVCEAVTAG